MRNRRVLLAACVTFLLVALIIAVAAGGALHRFRVDSTPRTTLFCAALDAAVASGLVAVANRTVFIPQDKAFLHHLSIPETAFLASPPAELASFVAQHVSRDALTADEAAVAAAGGRLSARAAADGASFTLSLTPRGRALRRAPMRVTAGGPGKGGMRVLASFLSSRGLIPPPPCAGSAAVVHIIDGVLMPPAAAAACAPGPHATAAILAAVPRRNASRAFDVTLHAPLSMWLDMASPTRFPVVVFSTGLNAPVWAYSTFLAHIASHGHIVVAPRRAVSLLGAAPSPADASSFADDVVDAASWAASLPRAAPAPVGLAGHSLGGGVAALAASRLRSAGLRLGALLLLAPCDILTSPPPSEAVASLPIAAPVVVLAGERDGACPPGRHSRAIFEAAAASARPPPRRAAAALLVLRNGTHCFTEAPTGVGGSECGPQWRAKRGEASILLSQAAQLRAARCLAAALFDGHLMQSSNDYGDAAASAARALLWGSECEKPPPSFWLGPMASADVRPPAPADARARPSIAKWWQQLFSFGEPREDAAAKEGSLAIA